MARPVVAKNVVLVGASRRGGTAPRSMKNTRVHQASTPHRQAAVDLPHDSEPGEFGNDTWLEKSWAYTGNTGVWTKMTIDEKLGIAYLPVEGPTGDYYGGGRPGNNCSPRVSSPST